MANPDPGRTAARWLGEHWITTSLVTAKPALANTLPDLLHSNSQEAFTSAGEESTALHSASGHGRSSSQESLLLHMYVLHHCQEESPKQIPQSNGSQPLWVMLGLWQWGPENPTQQSIVALSLVKGGVAVTALHLNNVPLLSAGMQEAVSVPLNGENGALVVPDHVTAQDPRMEPSLPTQ